MSLTLYFVFALALLVAVLYGFPRETFQSEFLDKTQVDRTVAVENSSFAQTTNHMRYAPASMGPLQGMETPFQVNQYKAYVQ
jgi:hypothetical protein